MTKKNKGKWLLCLLMLCTAALTACSFFSDKTTTKPAPTAEESAQGEETKPSTQQQEETVPEGTQSETESGQIPEIVVTPQTGEGENLLPETERWPTVYTPQTLSTTTEKEEPAESGTGRPVTYINDPALSNQWAMLDETATVAQRYYTDNFSKTRIITKDGYLYNKAAEEKITVDYFVAEGTLPSSYRNQGIEILLLNCDDMRRYDDFQIKPSETGLAVFAAMKHPTENMYLLTTGKSAGGALSSAQYAALLSSYYQNHGSVGRLYPGAEEYNRILSFISMYESQYEDYAVRSIVCDNKYAVATLSPSGNTADVREYVLRRSGSIWEVVVPGLESDPRAVITVNKALPDFNLDMLPDYCINDYRNSLNNSNLELINQLIAEQKVSISTEVKYMCSTSTYGYVVLNNEVKYLCTAVDGGWNIVMVSTPDEARRKMLSISKSAPTFIILDQ